MIFVESHEDWAKRQIISSGSMATVRGAGSIDGLRGVQHPRAPVVLAAMPTGGTIGMWALINKLTKETKPSDYAQRRFRLLSFWGAVRALLSVKLLYRHGGLISRQPIAYFPQPRRRTSVGSQTTKTRHSKRTAPPSTADQRIALTVHDPIGNTGDNCNPPTQLRVEKTQSAVPSSEEIANAGRELARLPRFPGRRWTGFVDGRRRRRGFPAIASNGQSWEVLIVRRGVALAVRDDGDVTVKWLPLKTLKVPNNKSAVLLGRLKRGVRERPSTAKAASARVNGAMACRPGKRRGRPRKA